MMFTSMLSIFSPVIRRRRLARPLNFKWNKYRCVLEDKRSLGRKKIESQGSFERSRDS